MFAGVVEGFRASTVWTKGGCFEEESKEAWREEKKSPEAEEEGGAHFRRETMHGCALTSRGVRGGEGRSFQLSSSLFQRSVEAFFSFPLSRHFPEREEEGEGSACLFCGEGGR